MICLCHCKETQGPFLTACVLCGCVRSKGYQVWFMTTWQNPRGPLISSSGWISTRRSSWVFSTDCCLYGWVITLLSAPHSHAWKMQKMKEVMTAAVRKWQIVVVVVVFIIYPCVKNLKIVFPLFLYVFLNLIGTQPRSDPGFPQTKKFYVYSKETRVKQSSTRYIYTR